MVADSQAAYRARHGRYAPTTAALGIPFRARITRADSSGWTAVLSDYLGRPALITCGTYGGPPEYSPDTSVTGPGAVGCWEH